ncbi:ubiquitin-conjugating enzyme e2 [Moniliophthora roreri MCA 2997]|uniref:Ubiquitin-conjugating enzyme e2 n=1 Tax=Moniliophthora roreri (strain MCA 2997) TaxID=1381753 RepID=V2XKF3_MONRO|nr:ubiquitin-conjugating enzyme e2 [Moniliophthora roreri MCA 2997]
MATTSSMNRNNAAVKRIMQEARELANDPSSDYSAAPLEDDIFEWHCTIRGPQGTEFEGGLYHVRILLPAEYPFRPPSLMVLTPNGRFELNTKICISFTNYHEELWQPAWGVRTAILGLQGFFPLRGQAAVGVGSIEFPAAERKRLATLSRAWCCPTCQQTNLELLPDPVTSDNTKSSSQPADSGPAPTGTESSPLPQSDVSAARQTTRDAERNAIDPDVSPSPVSPQQPAPPRTEEVGAQPDIQGPQPSPTSRPTNLAPSASPRARPVAYQAATPTSRPPLMLDTAIGVILVLVFALICRRIF